MAAAVVDGRDTDFPLPYNEKGITPFGGDFALATTQLDDTDDKTVLFGPFPTGSGYITRLEVYCPDLDSGTDLVWDLSKGDLDGTIDSGGELIDASTTGQAAGKDFLDDDNLMFDMSGTTGKYLLLHVKTGGAGSGTINVYGEYAAGLLKHNVD